MEDPNDRSLLPLLKGGLLILVIGFLLCFFLLAFGVESKLAIFIGWEFIPITMMVWYMKQYHLKETKDEDREYYRMIVRIALMVFMAVLVPVIVFL